MTENRVVRVVFVALTALTVGIAAVGCGVSATGPTKIGDAAVAGNNPRFVAAPPGPDDAQLPTDLVSNYLAAAVESGSGSSLQRLEAFLTPPARATLDRAVPDTKNPPNPVIIRLLGPPVEGLVTESRRPVDVRYERVGPLTAQGRVDRLEDANVETMRFWVKTDRDNQQPRIDEITGNPPPIMITDEALSKYYQVQPVYFWDGAFSKLIPDIRYVPGSFAADVAANRIVQWLVDGPSPWLPEAQRLPSGTALKSPVVLKDGRLEVNLTGQAGVGAPTGIQRLYQQVQWSLQTNNATPKIDLFIDDKMQTNLGGIDDYRPANLSYTLPTPPRRFDILDGKVTQLGVSAPPPLLSTKENAGVVYAGVNRNASALALVRTRNDGKRYLQVVHADGSAVTVTDVQANVDMGRPVWVGANVLLIPSGGELYSVSTTGNGTTVTPNRLNKIHQVAVSPDGRRVAMVADGQAYLTSLTVTDNSVTIGATQRPILPGQVDATAVAWTSESWLYVAGGGAVPALWKVTADSVIGFDQSSSLAGYKPDDLVAFPTPPFAPGSDAEVLLYAGQNVYQVLPPLNQDPKLHAPFFGL